MPLPGILLIALLCLTALVEAVCWANNRRTVSIAFAMDETLAVLEIAPAPLGVTDIAKETHRHANVIAKAVTSLSRQGLITRLGPGDLAAAPRPTSRYLITPAGRLAYLEGSRVGKIHPP